MKRLITFGDYEKPRKRLRIYGEEERKKRRERYLKRREYFSNYDKEYYKKNKEV